MKVLIADKFEPSGLDGLKAAGCAVFYQPDTKDAALVEAIRKTEADVLVVRSTQVTKPMLEAGALKLVVRAGAGYNTIDVATASHLGIYVSNCPGKNSIAVAELAFALISALDRRVAGLEAHLAGDQPGFAVQRALVVQARHAAVGELIAAWIAGVLPGNPIREGVHQTIAQRVRGDLAGCGRVAARTQG